MALPSKETGGLVVLHVGGGGRLRGEAGSGRQAPDKAGKGRQVDGLRDIEQIEGDNLPRADLRHPRIVPCRPGVTVVNFSSASLPRHTASIAFCHCQSVPWFPEVSDALVWVPLAVPSSALPAELWRQPRVGAVRQSRRRRHGARRLRRGRAGREGHADQHRHGRVADAHHDRRGQLRIRGRPGRASTS